ncbi:MAG: hypothetical protein ACSLE7_09820 [Mycobacterium sp.]
MMLTHDLDVEGGLVRRISDQETNSFAIIDASEDAITVNWSTWMSPSQVVEFLDMYTSIDLELCQVTLGLADQEIEHLNFDQFQVVRKHQGEHFDDLCNFLRLDVSETRTYEWQLLLPSKKRIVGIGESTAVFYELSYGFVGDLLDNSLEPPMREYVEKTLNEFLQSHPF